LEAEIATPTGYNIEQIFQPFAREHWGSLQTGRFDYEIAK